MNKTELPQPLIPHVYPLWIKMGFSICLIFFAISMIDLPYYFKINTRAKRAHAAFLKQNYYDASNCYAELAFLLPQNKKIKIKAAKSFFKLPTKKDHELGLGFLREISFTKDEWKDLLNYIPAQYIELFQDIKC